MCNCKPSVKNQLLPFVVGITPVVQLPDGPLMISEGSEYRYLTADERVQYENNEEARETVAAFDGSEFDTSVGEAADTGPDTSDVSPLSIGEQFDTLLTSENYDAAMARVRATVIEQMNSAIAKKQPFELVVLTSKEPAKDPVSGQDGLGIDIIIVGTANIEDRILINEASYNQLKRTVIEQMTKDTLAFVLSGPGDDGAVEVGGEGVADSCEPDALLVADDDGMQAAIGSAHFEDKNHNGIDDAIEGYTGPDTEETSK